MPQLDFLTSQMPFETPVNTVKARKW